MAEEAGLPYRPGPVVSNSSGSLQLAEFAREAGALERLHPLLFRAYWQDGRDIGDIGVLADVAEQSALDVEQAIAAVRDRAYASRVRGSTEVAISAGVDGVPAWLVDERLLVPGAQPHDVFDRVLARLGFEPAGDGPAGPPS
jgi:predicted DsbA family dithiol-disulfide isomerase